MKYISWFFAQIIGFILKTILLNDPKIKQEIKEGDELHDKASKAVNELEEMGLQLPQYMKRYSQINKGKKI